MLDFMLEPFWTSYSKHFMSCILTHWGRVTHICVSKLTITGSDNGLSPDRRQAIIWTDAGILLMRPLRTNFSEILIEIYTFLFKKMHLKMSSGKWRPSCHDLNVLRDPNLVIIVAADVPAPNDARPLAAEVMTTELPMFSSSWLLTHCGLVTTYGNRSGSTSAQALACCLTAPSHYLNHLTNHQ